MALIFSRLAHNFIKNGYFPTDDATLGRAINALVAAPGSVRIHDPCAGEGVALAEIKHSLTTQDVCVQALGVEFDRERAWHAKQLLDVALHSDMNDVVMSPRSCGLLFLNPPYGDAVADKADTGDVGSDRLESIFLRRSMGCLQYGGVLVLVVPYYILDEDLASMLARNFERVRFFVSPEQRFKQCVIFGVRRRYGHPSAALVSSLIAAGKGERMEEVLPEVWGDEPYVVPNSIEDPDFKFHAVRIDRMQLAAEIQRYAGSTLWPQFQSVFSQKATGQRAPLRGLSRWHLALALAAGQITGTVRSSAGRSLFIKGDTFKEKARSVDVQFDEKGNASETVVLTDRFVPIIRGIDMTPGPTLGDIVTIR